MHPDCALQSGAQKALPAYAVTSGLRQSDVRTRQDAVTREYLSAISCVSIAADLRNVLQMCLDVLDAEHFPLTTIPATTRSTEVPTTTAQFLAFAFKKDIGQPLLNLMLITRS